MNSFFWRLSSELFKFQLFFHCMRCEQDKAVKGTQLHTTQNGGKHE